MRFETVTFNNDRTMPSIGLGVYKARGDEAVKAIKVALDTGYRLIDTAAIYGNEAEVGQAIQESDVDREDIFLTTKIWMPDYQDPIAALNTSLEKLKTDYVDLYLLHWPSPKQFDNTIKAYQTLEKAVTEGKIRSLGVSNFTQTQLDELNKHVKLTPVLNQIEVHPYFSQKDMLKVNSDRDIVTQAWSPIGGMVERSDGSELNVLKDKTIMQISEKYDRTPVQVMLRWHMQNGCSAIPKSVTPERIRSNFDVFDFHLENEDMALLDSLNKDLRAGPHPDQFNG